MPDDPRPGGPPPAPTRPTPPRPPPPDPVNRDYIAINVVIVFLGIFSLLGLCLVFTLLMFRERDKIGDGLSALIALVGTAVGSLASILAQTTTSRAPVPTTVVNPPDKPVPVTPEA